MLNRSAKPTPKQLAARVAHRTQMSELRHKRGRGWAEVDCGATSAAMVPIRRRSRPVSETWHGACVRQDAGIVQRDISRADRQTRLTAVRRPRYCQSRQLSLGLLPEASPVPSDESAACLFLTTATVAMTATARTAATGRILPRRVI